MSRTDVQKAVSTVLTYELSGRVARIDANAMNANIASKAPITLENPIGSMIMTTALMISVVRTIANRSLTPTVRMPANPA